MTNERNSYVLSMKKYLTSIHESPEKNTFKHVQTGKNRLRCGGLSTSAIKRQEKHEEERCVKCLPLSPVCCWLQLAASERNRPKKKRCNVAMTTTAYCHCVWFFLQIHITLFHRAVCRGWRWWWRRRGDLTHINSINSGRETRSNDMKKMEFANNWHTSKCTQRAGGDSLKMTPPAVCCECARWEFALMEEQNGVFQSFDNRRKDTKGQTLKVAYFFANHLSSTVNHSSIWLQK